MSVQRRLTAMRTAKLAIDATMSFPALVTELKRHGLHEQFAMAQKLINEETHAETMRLTDVSDALNEG